MTALKKTILPTSSFRSDRAPGWIAVTRGAALGMAILIALNLAEVRTSGTSAVENWMYSLRPLTESMGLALLALLIPSLLLYVFRPALPGLLRTVLFVVLLAMCFFSGQELLQANSITDPIARNAAIARPLGLVLINLVIVFGVLGCAMPTARGRSSVLVIVLSSVLTIVGFPILSIQTEAVPQGVDTTSAGAVLVFAATGDGGGEISEAMEDRLQTAVKQLKRNPRSVVLLCGDSGDRVLVSSQQMRGVVEEAGIPERRILVDDRGGKLQEVLQRVRGLPQLKDEPEVVMVGHWYELARLKLLSRRSGLRARMIAAEQQHALFGQNRLVLSEAWQLFQAMAEPAMQFLREVRVPSETELEQPVVPDKSDQDQENPFREEP